MSLWPSSLNTYGSPPPSFYLGREWQEWIETERTGEKEGSERDVQTVTNNSHYLATWDESVRNSGITIRRGLTRFGQSRPFNSYYYFLFRDDRNMGLDRPFQ